jgi:hypothetical protein
LSPKPWQPEITPRKLPAVTVYKPEFGYFLSSSFTETSIKTVVLKKASKAVISPKTWQRLMMNQIISVTASPKPGGDGFSAL